VGHALCRRQTYLFQQYYPVFSIHNNLLIIFSVRLLLKRHWLKKKSNASKESSSIHISKMSSNNLQEQPNGPPTIKKSKKKGVSDQFSRLTIRDGSGKYSLSQLMEREDTPSPEDVTVVTAQREKAVATKKYLTRKYAERRKHLEMSRLRRKAFEVCRTVDHFFVLFVGD